MIRRSSASQRPSSSRSHASRRDGDMSPPMSSLGSTTGGNASKSGQAVELARAPSGELDLALVSFSSVFELLIKLAEIEKSAENIADELEKTRRRVNALEHVLIPNLQDTVKFIYMKLSEAERSAITGTMRIKNMLEEQEKAERQKKA